MKLVLIEWVDASSRLGGWHYLDENDSTLKCLSIGLVCREDESQIVLALSRNEGGLFSETFAIPKGCIKRMRQLRVNPL
jgi:hypothetical protein